METILIVIEVLWVLGFLAVFGVYFYWRRKINKADNQASAESSVAPETME